jgi:peptidoglycan/xylan/chitin deacetylase (PgdA/CDA1 family)
MYHYIRNNPVASDRLGYQLSVTPADFDAQLSWMKQHGFHTVNLGDVLNAARGAALPANPVVLTFDDGYADFATTAVPMLLSHGFTATVYVVPNFIGRPNYMTSDQLGWVSQQGMTVGAHTMDHVCLTKVPPAVAADQINRSRLTLQRWTGQPVSDFAYPYGRSNSQVAQFAAAAGFATAVITDGSSFHGTIDRVRWGRMRVGGGESLAAFASRLSTG